MQATPTKREWALWKQALCLLAHGSTQRSRSLQTPLGPWTCEPYQTYKWFFSPSSLFVYHKRRYGWTRYRKSSRSRTHNDRLHYIQESNVLYAPDDIQPTSLLQSPNASQIWIEGSAPRIIKTPPHEHLHWFHRAAVRRSSETASLL